MTNITVEVKKENYTHFVNIIPTVHTEIAKRVLNHFFINKDFRFEAINDQDTKICIVDDSSLSYKEIEKMNYCIAGASLALRIKSKE